METRSKWYKWEVLALLWGAYLLNQGDRQVFNSVLPLIRDAQALLTQLKSLGYNGFDMDTESELALSAFQRFEQLEQFKQHENTH